MTAVTSCEETQAGGELVAGRYELLGLLGAGAMGSVYRARDVELDEIVALKVLRRELVGAPGVLERFRREVKLARRVTHANVARVFDIGEHRGERFLTMELVEGESVGAILARERRLSVARAVEIAVGVCNGLAAAHAAGVIHRDLKPDNVLVAAGGRVVVTDFGIARALDGRDGATATAGAIVGTPAYMAPEQVQGLREVDARADLYALGAMLYELVVGERPWQGESIIAVAAARLLHDAPDPRQKRPDLPDALVRVIRRCLARSPDDRYASASEVASELSSLTLPASDPTLAKRLPAPIRTASGEVGPSCVSSGIALQTAARPAFAKSVAVLPFENLGAAEDGFVGEALADELVDALSTARDVRVCARGTVRSIDHRGDPREYGRALGVDVVVEGAVRRAGGKVQVRARLVSVADGFVVWSRRFERADGELLLVNEEVAREVLTALTADRQDVDRALPADPEVVDLYLRARVEYRKFWREDLARSIDLFEEALARAPDTPILLAGLALARARYWFYTGEGGPIARAAAERAVALAPGSADAHLALASVLFQGGELEACVREARLAIERAPALADAQLLLGRILIEVGHASDGIRRIELALALDPNEYSARRELTRHHALAGEWARVDELLARPVATPEQELARMIDVARYSVWRRDIEGVRRLRDQLVAQNVPEGKGGHAIVWGIVRMMLEQAPPPQMTYLGSADENEGASRRLAFFAQIEAEIAAYYGDADATVAAVERAVEHGLIDRGWIERCPLLVGLGIDDRLAEPRAKVRRRCERVIAAYLDSSR